MRASSLAAAEGVVACPAEFAAVGHKVEQSRERLGDLVFPQGWQGRACWLSPASGRVIYVKAALSIHEERPQGVVGKVIESKYPPSTPNFGGGREVGVARSPPRGATLNSACSPPFTPGG